MATIKFRHGLGTDYVTDIVDLRKLDRLSCAVVFPDDTPRSDSGAEAIQMKHSSIDGEDWYEIEFPDDVLDAATDFFGEKWLSKIKWRSCVFTAVLGNKDEPRDSHVEFLMVRRNVGSDGIANPVGLEVWAYPSSNAFLMNEDGKTIDKI